MLGLQRHMSAVLPRPGAHVGRLMLRTREEEVTNYRTDGLYDKWTWAVGLFASTHAHMWVANTVELCSGHGTLYCRGDLMVLYCMYVAVIGCGVVVRLWSVLHIGAALWKSVWSVHPGVQLMGRGRSRGTVGWVEQKCSS